MTKIRLDKFLTECGIASRKDVKRLLRKKFVKVNDVVQVTGKTIINELTDKVEFRDEVLVYKKS